jgi:hypothetical protein
MKILTSVFVFSICICLPFLGISQEKALRCPDKVKNSMIITYSDVNGNTYVIQNGKLEYKPVATDQSSSGAYNGGKAKKAKLSQKDFDRIAVAINTVIDTPETHLTNRTKTTVQIELKEGTLLSQWIISIKSLQIRELEKALQTALD